MAINKKLEKHLNEETIPLAIATMETCMNEGEMKDRRQAASDVLNGTIFKKDVKNNNLVLNFNNESLKTGLEVLKELVTGRKEKELEDVSVREFEEDREG
jgi:hypothetical protein